MARVRTRVNEPNWARDKAEARNRIATQVSISAQSHVQQSIVSQGRHISGKMLESVYRVRQPDVGERTTYRVGSSLDYFAYQNYGAGPIRPIRAKALKLHWRREGRITFAKGTSGIPAGRFLEQAISRIRLGDW